MNKEEEKQQDEENFDVVNMEILSAIVPDSFDDRAFGSILGAFVGDSCGSFLEFINFVASDA